MLQKNFVSILVFLEPPLILIKVDAGYAVVD